MTVVVGFLCHDGIVIGADSMLTPSMGGINVGHHKGQKVHQLDGGQLFAFAGDQGQAARFQHMAHVNHALPSQEQFPIDYALKLSAGIINQFNSTGLAGAVSINALLSFPHGGEIHLCAFEGMMQPRLLDRHHYYVALGSGKLSADPFLRFLVDIFCTSGPPSVREAVLLSSWAIQHVIDTNPGGVAEPIKIVTCERNASSGGWLTRELSANEIDDQGQAIESARQSLRDWRDSLAPPANGAPPANPVPAPPSP